MTGDRWLIAGLGNPGPSYAGNRHNAGFLTADVLAARAGAKFRASKVRAMVAEGHLAGFSVIIIKPITFMNESGIAVGGVSNYHRIGADRIVVITTSSTCRSTRSGSSAAAGTTDITAFGR